MEKGEKKNIFGEKQNMYYACFDAEDVNTEAFDKAYDRVERNIKRLPKVEKYRGKVMLWGIKQKNDT
jgi:hypothetical protein